MPLPLEEPEPEDEPDEEPEPDDEPDEEPEPDDEPDEEPEPDDEPDEEPEPEDEEPDEELDEEPDDFTQLLNPDSLEVKMGFVEPSLAEAKTGDTFQFIRMGYYCADPDGSKELPVFNRVVGLKDSFRIS